MPEPLLEPPAVCSVFHGLRGVPKGWSIVPPIANSLRFSLPSSTAPASSRRRTIVESSSGTKSANTFDPPDVSTPFV